MLKNVKITTIINLLDLLAPHSCRGCGLIGKTLCDRCKKNIIDEFRNHCPNCKRLNLNNKCQNCKHLPETFVVSERSNLMGKLINDLKYHSVRALKTPLAEIIDSVLPKAKEETIIVPLPTIPKHIRSRGLDHTYLIAKELTKYRQNHHVEKILTRNTNTVQVGANEKTRKEQAEHTYKIAQKSKIDPEKNYLLLDDVWTTGASMKAAQKKLQKAGAKKIQIVILAVNRLD